MSNDDLDTLRPEVREAVDAFDIGARVGMTFGNKTWNTIRAELLHLAVRNAELEAKATRDHEWFNDLLTENKKAEAELAALKARIADGWLCGVSNDKCPGNFDAAIYCLPSRFRGKRVRLVVDNDD